MVVLGKFNAVTNYKTYSMALSLSHHPRVMSDIVMNHQTFQTIAQDKIQSLRFWNSQGHQDEIPRSKISHFINYAKDAKDKIPGLT